MKKALSHRPAPFHFLIFTFSNFYILAHSAYKLQALTPSVVVSAVSTVTMT
jgi:hypothetical protein